MFLCMQFQFIAGCIVEYICVYYVIVVYLEIKVYFNKKYEIIWEKISSAPPFFEPLVTKMRKNAKRG